MYYVRQMSSGLWYVLRTARSTMPPLECENGGFDTKQAATRSLRAECKVKGIALPSDHIGSVTQREPAPSEHRKRGRRRR